MTVVAAPDVVGDRVVHERRQAAEPLDRLRDGARDLLLDAVVRPDVQHLAARFLHAGRHLVAVRLVPARERDRGAFGGEHLHDPPADAPRAAGHQRDLPVEPHAHPFAPCIKGFGVGLLIRVSVLRSM